MRDCETCEPRTTARAPRFDVPGDIIDKIMGWAPAGVRAKYYVKTKDLSLQRAILKLYADDPLGV